MSKVLPTADRLRELFSYDPATGLFTRRVQTAVWTKVGEVAGSFNRQGYVKIRFDGAQYSAHRLAWLYVYGKWPEKQIDHIDEDKANNRIANLRDVDQFKNQQNRSSARRDSTTGLLGAHLHPKGTKFKAAIRFAGKSMHTGMFDTAEQAHQAYLLAKAKLQEPAQ